jgi:hypothetical protein
MFLRYSIELPKDRVISGYGQPRKIVAKASLAIEDQEFVRYLLWVDNSHIPRSGLSPFRFTSARRGRSLDIIALGRTAVEQLLAKGHHIAAAVSRKFGTSPSDEREIGMCSIHLSSTPNPYNIPRMIIQKYQYESKFRAAEREHTDGRPSPILLDHVAKIIRRDLVRQAELMLVDIPQEIEIGNLELADLQPVQVVLGRHNLSANVRFAMSHKLLGQWAVGHLASRGYGRIFSVNPRSPD